jgi:hypothetical protein
MAYRKSRAGKIILLKVWFIKISTKSFMLLIYPSSVKILHESDIKWKYKLFSKIS